MRMIVVILIIVLVFATYFLAGISIMSGKGVDDELSDLQEQNDSNKQ